ncbi:putative 15-hydroxyprostaglandin dehydrogenase [Seiridium unicorne]|uniref:15-hydroxyprostaglandin dehydrogenase n=1 Tax=Seiridium unicorne TaxID=138068 RepID=A0ABR2UJK0_9PEZI
MSKYELKGKVAVITGAGSGICHALATRLLEAGASLLVADIHLRPEAEETYSKYPHPPKQDGLPSALYHETDISNWTAINSLWEKALDTFGRVDIVINGAGIYEPPSSTFWELPGVSPLAKDDPDALVGQYKTFGVNTIGPIRLAQLAVDYWLKNSQIEGNLLWFASVGGYVHSLQTPLYFASKSAIISVVKSLGALKAKFGIRNSAICPGLVYTPIFHPDYCKDRVHPDDLTLTPEQCAAVALDILLEPQYGDGNIVEAMLVGKRGNATVNVREVPLEALYPTAGPVGEDNHLLEEEQNFAKKIQEKSGR